MGRLDKAQDRARDLIGEIGDGLRKRVPDKAVQLIETGAALGAVRTGAKVASGFVRRNPVLATYSTDFDAWLRRAATADAAERGALLTQWDRAPNARHSHPREEHLLPLMVAAGASGAPGQVDYNEVMLGSALSGYRFG